VSADIGLLFSINFGIPNIINIAAPAMRIIGFFRIDSGETVKQN
jgi:hypothetical protein